MNPSDMSPEQFKGYLVTRKVDAQQQLAAGAKPHECRNGSWAGSGGDGLGIGCVGCEYTGLDSVAAPLRAHQHAAAVAMGWVRPGPA